MRGHMELEVAQGAQLGGGSRGTGKAWEEKRTTRGNIGYSLRWGVSSRKYIKRKIQVPTQPGHFFLKFL